MKRFFNRSGGKRLLAKRLAGVIDGRAPRTLLRALYGRSPGVFCATTHTHYFRGTRVISTANW